MTRWWGGGYAAAGWVFTDNIVQWMRLLQGATFGIDGGQQLVEG